MKRSSLRFQFFALDLERLSVHAPSGQVDLRPKSFEVLRYLAEHAGRVVTKDEVIKAIWPDVTVTDDSLARCISDVRRALGDERQRIIKTIPRRGYLFDVPVSPADATEDATDEDLPTKPSSRAGLDPRPETAFSLPDKPSIAVLPFVSLSADPGQEYFADGITEDIITGLSKLRNLFVIARTSTLAYKGHALDLKQVARDLGVRFIVEGTVRMAGKHMRTTARLIDAEVGNQVWGERFDRPIEDLFKVQDEITDSIVTAVEPEISAAERARARRKLPEHLGAWELYQRGMWHLLRRICDDLSAAYDMFHRAASLDQTFATAHAGVAICCFHLITHGFTEGHSELLSELFDMAARAVALDLKEPLAHTALGLAFMERREHSQAIAEHQTAVSLSPNSSYGRYGFGYALLRADLLEEALEQFDSALRLSPRDPGLWSYLTLKASTLYQLRRYQDAANCARDAARYPIADLVWPCVHLSAALGQLGRESEATAAVDDLRRRRPGLTISQFRLWVHNFGRPPAALEHVIDGLRRAGLPE